MSVYPPPASESKSRHNTPPSPQAPKHGSGNLLFLILLTTAVLIGSYQLFLGKESKASPVVTDDEGNVTLSPERQAKLDKELEEIDNAEQYALVATVDGFYPCLTCPDASGTIYLYVGEVWKYGVTRVGEKRRYPNQNYGAPDLTYVTQFIGNYTECLKMEKTKIYSYPLLPEARKRDVILIRPPGNANDS